MSSGREDGYGYGRRNYNNQHLLHPAYQPRAPYTQRERPQNFDEHTPQQYDAYAPQGLYHPPQRNPSGRSVHSGGLPAHPAIHRTLTEITAANTAANTAAERRNRANRPVSGRSNRVSMYLSPETAAAKRNTAFNDRRITRASRYFPAIFGTTPDLSLSLPAAEDDDDDEDDCALAMDGIDEDLDERQRKIIEEQTRIEYRKVSFRELVFRYSTFKDKMFMLVGVIAAYAAGSALPLMTLIFGGLINDFRDLLLFESDPSLPGAITPDKFQSVIDYNDLFYVYLGIGIIVTTYIYTASFIWTGEKITRRIRENYLKAILRQNVAYFDTLGAGEVTTRISSDTLLIQDGISEKIPMTVKAFANFITAYVLAYVKNPKLAGVLTTTLPVIMGSGIIMGSLTSKYQGRALGHYSSGSSLAEEVVSTIRSAVAFGTQPKLAQMYGEHQKAAYKQGTKKALAFGLSFGITFFTLYAGYALAFFFGTKLIVSHESNSGDVVTAFFSILTGSFSLGGVAPNFQAFSFALGAAAKIFETIDRTPSIDSADENGLRPGKVTGEIVVKHVDFYYPSRPNVRVLDNFSLRFEKGKTTALVGASGSGKSTIIGLVERFYDPVEGGVFLDGVDLKDLNVKWLRQQIALVSQEPTLFATNIKENIAYGLIGTPYENAPEYRKDALIREAAKMANADQFIAQLPNGYETMVGDRGFLLSGGQKQRIAIARAVVSQPSILLLDEATSALDGVSEKVVQEALDRCSKGRTTIVIAHRLATIRNADKIVVMNKGVIVEYGDHNSLIDREGGAYAKLVNAQRIATEEEKAKQREEDGEEEDIPAIQGKKIAATRRDSIRSISSVILEKNNQYVDADGKAKGDDVQPSVWKVIAFIMHINKHNIPLQVVGVFAAVISGLVYPAFAVLFSHILAVLQAPQPKQSDGNFWALMFFVIAIVVFISQSVSISLLILVSERLTVIIRNASFRAILRQDISYFDCEEHNAGAVVTSLQENAQYVQGLAGVTLATISQTVATVVGGIAVAMVFGWQLALVTSATIPVLILSGAYRVKLLKAKEAKTKAAYQESSRLACEAASAIRTVASLTREDAVWEQYHHALEHPAYVAYRSAIFSTTMFAFSEGVSFFASALAFWYGGTLFREQKYDVIQFFTVFIAIIFGSQSAGQVFAYAPDMSKAKQAAGRILALLSRQPEVDTWSMEGLPAHVSNGHIQLQDVHFRYPTRQHVSVLSGLNLEVKQGQYIALVGPSGCGKSTTIGLLEQFYRPQAGRILVDGVDISRMNINEYRRNISLVSQEPTLYQGTIRFNIALGANKPENLVTDDEIVAAAKKSNIHDFIMGLPDNYNTNVGAKGTALSGGQKQRIAIARALIREPKILLLDEATSALDSESEKIVQTALDAAAHGRTTIAVAHRLSTIQKADIIYVFNKGEIAEQGNHSQLMALRGQYYNLVKQQQLEKAG